MLMIPTYGKVYNLHNKLVGSILDTPVQVQEKLDGSQMSWMNREGELIMQSRGTILDLSLIHI